MKLSHQILYLTLFSIAMGFLESSVVIYLRELLYGGGFQFPMAPIPSHLLLVEIYREAATLVMLLMVGMLTGKNKWERFAFFLLSFAVWDIFYYVFLYLFKGWPSSLLDWDILFLIPLPWYGQVITPLIICVCMLLLASIILDRSKKGFEMKLPRLSLLAMLLGCGWVLLTFVLPYVAAARSQVQSTPGLSIQQALISQSERFVPVYFNWWMYAAGIACILGGILLFYSHNSSHNLKKTPT